MAVEVSPISQLAISRLTVQLSKPTELQPAPLTETYIELTLSQDSPTSTSTQPPMNDS